MKFFLQRDTHIRIVNDTAGWQEWQGTLAEFLVEEPEYPGLPAEPAGLVLRSQTEERQYLQDADGGQYPDAFNALGYCDTIGTYPAWSPPDPDSLINDAITATDTTWSSTKIDSEISSGGGGGGLPVGVIVLWYFGTPPLGWYKLDGVTTIPEGSELGIYLITAGLIPSGGVVTLPNFKQKYPFGASADYPEMTTGGSLTHTLSTNQMPIHGGHGGGGKWVQGSTNTEVGTKATTQAGGGLPFPIMPAYFTINFIIYGGA